jgi:fermentation-respiration switch protein FrsA (DUF1100 family)
MSDGASGNWIPRWCRRISSPGGFEDSLVFQPRPFPDGDWNPPPGAEDAWFESADGTKLHGWFASPEKPRGVVLFCHGNTGSVAYFKNHIRLFREKLNVAVLCFDYRGYGRSEGRPTEAGVFDDARAARKWLATRCGIPEADVILAGHSLGGGVVADLASKDGARGLILWNTFTSVPDVAKSFVPLLPVKSLMHNRFDSVAKIGDYHGPLLQSHGDADLVIPFDQGKRLFARANEPKRFVPVHGGGHNDPPSPEFLSALNQFFGSK